MAARRSPGNAKPITGPVLIASVAAAGYGIYSGYPGLAAIWLGLLVAAWSYPPAVFSGKKDSRGYATAGGPGETAAMNRYRFWDDLKFKLIIPTGDWLPGFKPLLSWMWAVWSGAFAYFIPVSDTYTTGYGQWINAAAAYIVVAQLTASRRRTMVEGDENPGARIDSLWKMTVDNPARTIGLTLGGLIVGGVLGTVATVMIPLGMELAGLPSIPEPVLWSLFLTGGPLALLAKPWITAALEHWRIVVAAREEWDQRWMMLKQDPAPRLVDRREVGTAIIDTFDAPGSVGAMAYWAMGPKIGPTLGGGAKFAVLSTPDLDSQNQPRPGSRHPLRFDIVRWPADQLPDVTDPSTPKEVVHEFVRCALVWAADGAGGYGRPLLDEVHLLTVPPAPAEKKPADPTESSEEADTEPAPASAAWAATWFLPDGPPADTVRSVLRGGIQEHLQVEALVDHRYGNGAGCMYFGDLSADAPWQPGPTNATLMENLRDEDVWNARWIEIMKMGSNPPVVQAPTARSASLANGVSVNTIAFVTRQGMTPNEFFNFEPKLKTAMNASPFVAITGYPGEGRRPGERHPQAFSVYWSAKAVPARPDELAPVPRSDAPKWVLAGLLNEAFKAARLADRPELVSATCLTKPDSRAHIWRIDLRLYGGVTLAEVRGAAQKIRQSWGSEWLRVTAAKDGCTIVVGAKPSRVKLANPRYEQELAALDWDQAFQDSGISGVGGLMPVLTKVDCLPHNDQVSVLDFDLPAGLDFTSFTGARTKLESASGNFFVEPRRVKDRSNQIQLLVCEVNPMPEKADYDWAHIEASKFIPFATGIDGEPIEYNFRVDPHLLVAGASGGGKNFLLNSYVPVPVSERFPTGWAMNKELVEGDLVYAADGSTTRILGFSDVVTEPVYNVKFTDGQVVEVGGNHLWKVSSAASRAARTPLKTTAREARESHRNTRAAQLRELAAQIGAGTVAPLDDIARLAGYNEFSLHQMDLRISELATIVNLPSKKKSKQFDMTPIAAWLGQSKSRAGGVVSFAGKTLTLEEIGQLDLAGRWLTMREMADTVLGQPSTRREREAAKLILRRLKPASREGYTTFATPVYPVDEVLTILAERLEYQAVRSDSGIKAPDLEAVVSTREMAKAVIRRTEAREALNYAVRATAPIDGPDLDLPVDPYVIGAWLGDGSRSSGVIWSGSGDTCTDAAGLTDQQHLLAQLNEHYRAYPSHSNDRSVCTSGLAADLRTAGVLNDKHIPAVYLRASYSQRLALLQGLMDTDGTINANGSSEIDLCHKPLADGVLELIRSLGILVEQRPRPAAITEADPENPGQKRQRVTGTRYRLKFTTGLPIFRLPRKLERVKSELRSTQQWNYIEEITVSEPQPMRCLKVEHPEHLYLTHGFIPTHNSVLLQSLAFGALMRGYELYVADPTKGGADFKFAEPYAQAFTATPFEAAAMMRSIYAEVVRRKNLNSAHGVGKYSDLPEEIRPKHICILLDEFTSLMGQDPVPPASDDPELDAEREMIIAVNRAKTDVGVFAGKIAREARSAGVTLFLATQKLSAKMLDTIPGAGDLKVNLSRLLLGKATYGDKQSALRAPQDAPELGNAVPPGRGLFETTAGAAMVIQSWYNTAEQRILAQKLAEQLAPLDESDKADLSPFMPKMPTPYGLEDVTMAAEPEITDLGDMEFTLEELEFDLEIEEMDTVDIPAEPTMVDAMDSAEPAAALPYAADTLMLLDVDGSLLPFRHTPDMTPISIPGSGAQGYRSDVVSRLSSLPVRQMWLTSRSDAEDALGHLFPAVERSLSVNTDETGWWKIDAVVALLEQDRSIRRIIWIDDELSETDPLLGIPLADVAREAFRNVEALLVVPDSFNGVTGAELGMIEQFLARESHPVIPFLPELELAMEPAIEPVLSAAIPAATPVVHPGQPTTRKVPVKQMRDVEDPFEAPVKPFRGKRVTQPDDDPFQF